MASPRDNGLLVLEALTEFGAPVELAAAQFENPRTLLVLGREPFRVDILTAIRGLDFDRALAPYNTWTAP